MSWIAREHYEIYFAREKGGGGGGGGGNERRLTYNIVTIKNAMILVNNKLVIGD